MRPRLYVVTVPMVLGMFLPYCGGAVRPTVAPAGAPPVVLWEEPRAAAADLFNGPWGAERAPDPNAVYRLVGAPAAVLDNSERR